MMVRKVLAALAFVTNLSASIAPNYQKAEMVCTVPGQTRNVSGLSIFRECQEYQDTYQCRGQNIVNNCQPLRDKECSQIESSCVECDDSGTCVMYKQKYSCPDEPETYTEKTMRDQSAFCQNSGIGCLDTSVPLGKDFGQATVMMETAHEAGMYDIGPGRVETFRGHMEECSIKVLDGTTLRSCYKSAGGGITFSNYALLGTGMEATGEVDRESIVLDSRYIYNSLYDRLGSSLVDEGLDAMNSWAPSLDDGVFDPQFEFYGLTLEFTFANDFQFVDFDPYNFALSVAVTLVQGWLSCGSAEQVMATERGQNLCVRIEVYCSKKVLRVCVEKKECHYCFNPRLAKIIDRQGRAQLGVPMSSYDSFSQAQLQTLDFFRIDLSRSIADTVLKDMSVSAVSSQVQQTVNRKAQGYHDQ